MFYHCFCVMTLMYVQVLTKAILRLTVAASYPLYVTENTQPTVTY